MGAPQAYTIEAIKLEGFNMRDIDVDVLTRVPLDRDLGGLEADIWRRVDTRLAERQAYRRTVALQVTILMGALVGSALAGWHWAAERVSADASVLSPYTQLAPSSLLVGRLR